MSGFENTRKNYGNTLPQISNPMITHMGKKSNQNILQSKLDR